MKKNPTAPLVGMAPNAYHDRHAKEEFPWKQAEDTWRISKAELRQRVSEMREEFELKRDQFEGVPFESHDKIPASLDHGHKELVSELLGINPRIDGLFKMIDEYADKHGCGEWLDFNSKLFELKMEAADTGFKIGVLAGVIFAGSSSKKIDKFERGLAFDLLSNSYLVKE